MIGSYCLAPMPVTFMSSSNLNILLGILFMLTHCCNLAVIAFVLFSFSETRGDHPYLVEVRSVLSLSCKLFVTFTVLLVISSGFQIRI